MNQNVPEIVGLQMAKHVEARMRAKQVLAAPDTESPWARIGLMVAGGASGGLLASGGSNEARLVLGVVAVASLITAVRAWRECARLRQQVDALRVLALQGEQ